MKAKQTSISEIEVVLPMGLKLSVDFHDDNEVGVVAEEIHALDAESESWKVLHADLAEYLVNDVDFIKALNEARIDYMQAE